MKWVKEHDPEKDGDYIVMRGYNDPDIDTFSFTVEGGWNTFYTSGEGKLSKDNALDCHVGDVDPWINAWLILSDGDPWRTGRPTEDGHYIVAMEGENTTMTFSVKNGWNALYDAKNMIDDRFVHGWMPKDIAKEKWNELRNADGSPN